MIPLSSAAVAAAMFAALSASALAAPTTLRASHQFPGGRGDVRDEMVQIIARDAKAANVDLEIQVYPGASLFKPNEHGTPWSTGSSTSRRSRSITRAARCAPSAPR